MHIDSETKRKLREMGASHIIDAISEQDEDIFMNLNFEDRVQSIVDYAYSNWLTERITRLTRRAHLRYPEADIRKIDSCKERGLDRQKIAELSTCGYVTRGKNIVLQGFTGSGKTYLGCALGKEACARQIRTAYIRIPDLEEQARVAKQKDALYKMIVRYSNFTVLILDEWLMHKPSTEFREFLLEIMERRYQTASTIFCTQYKRNDWHTRLGGGVGADSLMDRIVHNAIWIETGTKNMRESVNAEI